MAERPGKMSNGILITYLSIYDAANDNTMHVIKRHLLFKNVLRILNMFFVQNKAIKNQMAPIEGISENNAP